MKDFSTTPEVSSGKPVAASSVAAPRKVAIYLMAVLVLAVMLAWLGFLGWAASAMLSTLIEFLRTAEF